MCTTDGVDVWPSVFTAFSAFETFRAMERGCTYENKMCHGERKSGRVGVYRFSLGEFAGIRIRSKSTPMRPMQAAGTWL